MSEQPKKSVEQHEAAPAEGCTPEDARMLRAANHSLAVENEALRRALRPFARIVSTDRLSWAIVEYCIDGDPEKQTFQRPQMQRAFNRVADLLRENVPNGIPSDINPDDLPDWVKNGKPPAQPESPTQPAPSAPLEGTGNGADERDVLNRLVVILESGQAYNGIAHDNAAIYAKALRDLLEARAPRTDVAGAVPFAWIRANVPEYLASPIAYSASTELLKNAKEGYLPVYLAPQPPSADAAVAPAVANREDWQQKALDHGFKYWRAPDAHGVECTAQQAVDLLRDLLGVEVDIKDAAAAPEDELAATSGLCDHQWSWADGKCADCGALAQPSATPEGACNGSDERAAFEAYVKSLFNALFDIQRLGDGYADTAINRMWIGWQARAAASQPAAAAGQEAVAWETTHPAVCTPLTKEPLVAAGWREQGWHVVPLYTAPPAQVATRQELTVRQRMDLLLVADDMEVSGDAKLANALRALLAGEGQ